MFQIRLTIVKNIDSLQFINLFSQSLPNMILKLVMMWAIKMFKIILEMILSIKCIPNF